MSYFTGYIKIRSRRYTRLLKTILIGHEVVKGLRKGVINYE